MTDHGQPQDEDLEATVLGSRRAGAGETPVDVDVDEDTFLGIRRATAERGIRAYPSAPRPADRADRPAPATEPELEIEEITTLEPGADPLASAAAHVDERTVLSSRRVRGTPRPVPVTTDAIELDPEATVFDVRTGGILAEAVALPPGAHDDTVITPRRASEPAADDVEQTSRGFHQIPVDETTVVPRVRRTPTSAGTTDSPLRPAVVPDGQGARERYAARDVPRTPVYRTAPQERPRQAPADTRAAAEQQRAEGRRRLVLLLVVGGAVVALPVAGIVALLLTAG